MPPASRKTCSPEGVALETRSLAVITTGSVAAGGVASWATVAGGATPAMTPPSSASTTRIGTNGRFRRGITVIMWG